VTRPPSPDVMVIGSANADVTIRVDRRPGAGETVLGSDLALHPGGKGANQAVAAARLGAQVAFAGCIGSDTHGDLLLLALIKAGVDVSNICRLHGVPTGVALISLTPDGDNAIIVSPGANGHVTKGDVQQALGNGDRGTPRVVVLQLELPLPVVEHAMSLAAAVGARVVLNLAPPVPLPRETLRLCDPLVLNEHEAGVLLRRAAPVGAEAVHDLLETGPRSVVLTLGAAGAVTSWPGGAVQVPAPAVIPVDTTGAGDALTGALAWRLAEGDDLAEAVRFAVRVGSTATLLPGAQPSFPRAPDVLAPAPR
jgi:ribokinase